MHTFLGRLSDTKRENRKERKKRKENQMIESKCSRRVERNKHGDTFHKINEIKIGLKNECTQRSM